MNDILIGGDHLAALFTHIDAIVIAYDDDATITFASPAISDHAGWEPSDLIGKSVFTFLHPDDIERLADDLTRWVGRDGVTRDDNIRVRTSSGGWVELSMESVTGEAVAPIGAGIATLHPLRDRTAIEQELRSRLASEDRLTRLARSFIDVDRHSFDDGVRQALTEMGSLEGVDRIGVWQLDAQGRVHQTHEWVPPSVSPILGTLQPFAPHDLAFTRRLAALEEVRIADTKRMKEGWEIEQLGFEALGVRCWLAVPMAEAGAFSGFIAFSSQRPDEIVGPDHLKTLRASAGILAAAFARHRAEGRLAYQANHDALTGLANRWALMDEMRAAIGDLAQADTAGVALLLFDLDRFKVINDSLGHRVGDELLVGVAERLQRAVVGHELLARLGGDELVVLLRSVESAADAVQRAQELFEVFALPFSLGVNDIMTAASCGVAHTDDPTASADDLLRNADAAMYKAKERGRRNVVAFDHELQACVERRHRLERGFHRALTEGHFELHYQPEFDLATRSIVGVEALIRWRHPEDGLLTASEFIPVAEESGTIVDIGRWVLFEALRQLAEWQQDPALSSLTMRVNLSVRQLAEPDFVDQVTDAFRRSVADPGAVCFELTETELMADADHAMDVLDKLHGLGATLAVDDFGTGYSSLAYLHHFPIDVLKIDQAFVRDLGKRDGGDTIVRTMLSMADAMGLDVTAEGVENEEQLSELKRLGCPRAQGFLLARPQPPADVEALVRA